jgi:hypothetical protein
VSAFRELTNHTRRPSGRLFVGRARTERLMIRRQLLGPAIQLRLWPWIVATMLLVVAICAYTWWAR